jgi:hypothetical protein
MIGKKKRDITLVIMKVNIDACFKENQSCNFWVLQKTNR